MGDVKNIVMILFVDWMNVIQVIISLWCFDYVEEDRLLILRSVGTNDQRPNANSFLLSEEEAQVIDLSVHAVLSSSA